MIEDRDFTVRREEVLNKDLGKGTMIEVELKMTWNTFVSDYTIVAADDTKRLIEQTIRSMKSGMTRTVYGDVEATLHRLIGLLKSSTELTRHERDELALDLEKLIEKMS